MIKRGYGQPREKDSGGSDDDMSDEGTDTDTLPSTSRERPSEAAASAAAGSSHNRIEFYIGDHLLSSDMTVYQAVQQYGAPNFDVSDSDSDTRNGGSVYGSPSIWARIHTLYYR